MEKQEKESIPQPVIPNKNKMTFFRALSDAFIRIGSSTIEATKAMRNFATSMSMTNSIIGNDSYANISQRANRLIPPPEEYEHFMEVTGTVREDLNDFDEETTRIQYLSPTDGNLYRSPSTIRSYEPTTSTISGGLIEESEYNMSPYDEVDSISIISKRLGIGFRELLSAFTKLGETIPVRRDVLIEDLLSELLTKFDPSSDINLSSIRHVIFLSRGKYIGGKFFQSTYVADTIEFSIDEDKKPPTIRAIRIPNQEKTAPKIFINFTKKEDRYFGDCSLLFKIYNTDKNVIFVDDKIRLI